MPSPPRQLPDARDWSKVGTGAVIGGYGAAAAFLVMFACSFWPPFVEATEGQTGLMVFAALTLLIDNVVSVGANAVRKWLTGPGGGE